MYKLGTASLKELQGVHPRLILVVTHAIGISTQDFTVYDGARTKREQEEYVRRGTSKTLRSRHLIQKDGLGHAVDLVPWINGKARWEWGAIWPIALAVGKAGAELDIHLTWGGVWDRRMDQYSCGSILALQTAVEDYKQRHPGSDFLDGPHFELA